MLVKVWNTYLCTLLFLGIKAGKTMLGFCVFSGPIWGSSAMSGSLLSEAQHWNTNVQQNNRIITRVYKEKSEQIRKERKKVVLPNLKKHKFPSWVHVRSTGPDARREKLRYFTVVTGDLWLVWWRWDRDNEPVWESMLTEYTVPCNLYSIPCKNGQSNDKYNFIYVVAKVIMSPPHLYSKLNNAEVDFRFDPT